MLMNSTKPGLLSPDFSSSILFLRAVPECGTFVCRYFVAILQPSWPVSPAQLSQRQPVLKSTYIMKYGRRDPVFSRQNIRSRTETDHRRMIRCDSLWKTIRDGVSEQFVRLRCRATPASIVESVHPSDSCDDKPLFSPLYRNLRQ
jgi:hypothetical protein